jgi:sugar/nucleoside kinase (ribokinase family)
MPSVDGRAFDTVGLGLNSIDLLTVVAEHPRPNTKQRIQRVARLPGGQAATAMVTCARHGWRASYIGRFGDDEHGRAGIESLDREGVDLSHALVMPGATNQFAVIIVDARSGDRTVMWDRHPGLTMAPEDVPEEAVRSCRVLLVDCHDTQAATRAARVARAARIPTVIDVEKVRTGIGDLLREIDVIIAARDFPSDLTGHGDPGKALVALTAEFRPAMACVTLGEEGSLAYVDGREIHTPGFRVPVVDTTGAGDVFRGGFISGWLGDPHGDVESLLAFANACAGLKCRALGAREGIPPRDEVEALVRQTGSV